MLVFDAVVWINVGLTWWMDSRIACCVWCCKHFGYGLDLAGDLGHPLFLIEVAFLNTHPNHEQQGSRKRTVRHKSLVHAPGEKTSGCFHEQHSLNSSHLSLSPPSLHPQEPWLFHHRSIEQWGTQPAARSHSPAFFCLHPSTGCSLTHTLASHVSCLIPSIPLSLSLSWGRPSADRGHLSACNGGLRLWSEVRPLTARRRGTAATDAKTLPSVCVLEQAQLCHTVSVLD